MRQVDSSHYHCGLGRFQAGVRLRDSYSLSQRWLPAIAMGWKPLLEESSIKVFQPACHYHGVEEASIVGLHTMVIAGRHPGQAQK